MAYRPPRYIVWSTDKVDFSDTFQRRWYIRQVLLHGRAEDIRTLNLEEVARHISELNLPPHVESLWQAFLERKGYASR